MSFASGAVLRPGQSALAASSKVGLGTVLLLASVQFAAFVDRAVPSVVAGALKGEFDLTDRQIGALQGPAFALTYAAAMLAAGLRGRPVAGLDLGGGKAVIIGDPANGALRGRLDGRRRGLRSGLEL